MFASRHRAGVPAVGHVPSERAILVDVRTAVAVAVIGCASLVSGASAAPISELPSAFTRPATEADRLPLDFSGFEGRPYDSRRIASYKGTKRTWTVYIFKQRMRGFNQQAPAREHVCVFVFEGGGAGGGCSPSASFFGPGRPVNASSSRVLAGVASDQVARIAVVGSRGVVHHVSLSSDHGFIFNCRAFNGCACVLSRLQAFDKLGNRIMNQDWRSSAPNCRR